MYLILLTVISVFSFLLGLKLGKNVPTRLKTDRRLTLEETKELENFLSYNGSIQ